MKQATLLAIISIIFKILIYIIAFALEFINREFIASFLYQIFDFFSVLSYAGLLPFFIKLYKKQSDEI
ncbi:hypothetical protein ABEG63_07385 [Chryseobacterium sp. C39-AII1]|uniref:hypothetical protein n=1 Tax=Chryseobacterium sp. C39-AII1 TaxID=3080332 RepID=UPI00320A7789